MRDDGALLLSDQRHVSSSISYIPQFLAIAQFCARDKEKSDRNAKINVESLMLARRIEQLSF